MALVLGLGSGLFSLIVLWIVGVFGVFLLSRMSGALSNATIPVVLLLILTTVVMVVYPRKTLQEELQTQKQSQNVDTLSTPRIVIFTIICVFVLIGMFFLIQHWFEPIYAPAVTAKRTYAF